MSPYGQHKLMMEQLCRSYAITFGLRSTVARLFSVYGPNLRKQLLWDLCSRLHSGEQTLVLGGTGAEIRDWTDVRDVARFLVKINDWPQSKPFEIINGGSGVGTSVAEIAESLTKNWGGDIAVEFSGVVRAGDPFSLVADPAFAHAALLRFGDPTGAGACRLCTLVQGSRPLTDRAPVRTRVHPSSRRAFGRAALITNAISLRRCIGIGPANSCRLCSLAALTMQTILRASL